jgi:hypothetical protein
MKNAVLGFFEFGLQSLVLLGDIEELSRRNALDIATGATSADAFGATGRIAIRDLISRDATAFILGVGRHGG